MSRFNSILSTASRPDIVMNRGEGVYLYDQDDREYLDFIGGWAVNSLGHSPQILVDALHTQAKTLMNASPAYYNTPMIEFASSLTKHSCFDRVFFGSSGAEANESAIKLARKYGAKQKNGAFEIMTTLGSFHGRTLATMSATGKPQWKSLFEPKVPGFVHVPFNDIEAIRSAITPNTCAIMLELIQGEGGVNEANTTYISQLRDLCTNENILLIADEVQTGFSRTGTLFCYEHYGITPDIMTLGKGIGGGFPLSAMLCTEALNIFDPGDQGGTYTGQPLAMAIGLAVLNEVSRPEFLTHVQDMEHYIKTQITSAIPHAKNIRGKGLLLACDVPDGNATQIAQNCFDNGLIINAPNPNTIRLIPPLVITKAHVDDAIAILSEQLN